jgi:hypothetical protein
MCNDAIRFRPTGGVLRRRTPLRLLRSLTRMCRRLRAPARKNCQAAKPPQMT